MEAEYRQRKARSDAENAHPLCTGRLGLSSDGQITAWPNAIAAAPYDHAGAAFLQIIASSTSLLLPLSRLPPQPLRSPPMRLSLRLPDYFVRLRLPASLFFARFPEWCWPA